MPATHELNMTATTLSKRLEAELKLLKRLIIANDDFARAAQFARLIEERNLHAAPFEPDCYLLEAMTTALIVAYWRPFSENSGAGTVASLPKAALKQFTPPELRLHDRIGLHRNTECAHSDGDIMGVRVSVRELNEQRFVIPIHRDRSGLLSREDIATVRTMITKLLGYIMEQQLRIQVLLPAQERF